MTPMRRAVAAVVAGLGLVCGALPPASAADPPAAEVFFTSPDIGRAVLSPSGRWLAMSTSLAGERIALAVFDLRDWGW